MQWIRGNKLVHLKKDRSQKVLAQMIVSPLTISYVHKLWTSYPAWDGECNVSKKTY